MTDNDKPKLVANESTENVSTPPSPVDPDEKRAADKAFAEEGKKGQGPGATNEPK